MATLSIDRQPARTIGPGSSAASMHALVPLWTKTAMTSAAVSSRHAIPVRKSTDRFCLTRSVPTRLVLASTFGSPSCRESVCQYVSISVVDALLQKQDSKDYIHQR